MHVSSEHVELYHYEGEVTQPWLTQMVGSFDRILEEKKIPPVQRRRIISVAIEVMQNVMNYAALKEHYVPRVSLSLQREYVVLEVSNAVHYTQALFLRSYLSQLSKLSQEEIRQMYHNSLVNKNFSASGGGGLGLFQVFIRASKVEYAFDPINNEYEWYTLKAFFSV